MTALLATASGNGDSDVNYLLLVTSIVGGLSAAIAIGAFMRSLYQRSVGRRRGLAARLGRLGSGAQLRFFESTIGEPPAMRRSLAAEVTDYSGGSNVRRAVNYEHCIFIDREFYVTTLSDEDETVLGFSVTARGKHFRPEFTGIREPSRQERWRFRRRYREPFPSLFTVKLRRTTFAERGQGSPLNPGVEGAIGARTWTYSEIYSFGNPGHYQTYVFTSSVAAAGRTGDFKELHGALHRPGERNARGSIRVEDIESLANWRSHTQITTYTVLGPHVSLNDYPVGFGPHGDEVRTLP